MCVSPKRGGSVARGNQHSCPRRTGDERPTAGRFWLPLEAILSSPSLSVALLDCAPGSWRLAAPWTHCSSLLFFLLLSSVCMCSSSSYSCSSSGSQLTTGVFGGLRERLGPNSGPRLHTLRRPTWSYIWMPNVSCTYYHDNSY